ncbi:MAG: DUF4365 domain-containing protein [Gammaproteobacteria bacterium]|nr:DUF4365 domain-containing protein [Gammaproteobacteria bacterium]
MKDIIGQRGEAIFYVLITKFFNRDMPIFRPQFLGDKWPNVDFVVELTNYSGSLVPYFFVQVKSTREGYTKKEKRLKVQVEGKYIRALASYPAPAYIAGIDEKLEKGYIVSTNGESLKTVSSIPTSNPISETTQDILWNEVKEFWENSTLHKISSHFSDPNWRL